MESQKIEIDLEVNKALEALRLSFPEAKNATNRPSGDQKGNAAPSVPGTAWASMRSSGRIQMRDDSPLRVATNARRVPSGDSASCVVEAVGDGDHVVSGGGSTSNLNASTVVSCFAGE